MKKKMMTMMLGLVFMALAMGCASTNSAAMWRRGEMKTDKESSLVFIEGITFYEDVKEENINGKIQPYFLNERADEFSQKTSAAFRESFSKRLEESGIKVVDTIPNHPFIGIKVKMVYREIGSEILSERGVGVQFLAESLNLNLYQAAMMKLFLPSLAVGGHKVPAKRAAKLLGRYFADALAQKLNSP